MFTPVAASPFCSGIVAMLPTVTLCAGHAKYGWTCTLARAVKPAQAMFTPVAVSPFCSGIVSALPAVTLCAGHAKYGCTRTLVRAVKPAQAVLTPVAASPFCKAVYHRQTASRRNATASFTLIALRRRSPLPSVFYFSEYGIAPTGISTFTTPAECGATSYGSK